jgi:hypothetical protein
MNRAIPKANARNSLALSPTTFPIDLSESRDLADRGTSGKRFDISDFSDDLKVHEPMLPKPSAPVNGPPRLG